MPVNRVLLCITAALSVTLAAPLFAKSGRNPDFHLKCGFGSKRVLITTEGGLLIYRFGTTRHTELEIKENPEQANAFYRFDLLGVKGGGQQLRFKNGPYSYGVKSWFIAGRDGEEGSAFFLLKNGRLAKWRLCKTYDGFTEGNQLKRLQHDPLWVSAEGVETGDVPGVTPWEPRD